MGAEEELELGLGQGWGLLGRPFYSYGKLTFMELLLTLHS